MGFDLDCGRPLTLAVQMIADAREIIIMSALRRERRSEFAAYFCSVSRRGAYQSAGYRGQLCVVPKRLSLPLACTLVIQLMAMACTRRGKLYHRHA